MDAPGALRYRWMVKGDLDGFFGLAVDNLVQVLVIIALCTSRQLCNLPDQLVFGRILPGIAVSLVIGNLFYAWQAWRVARREGRSDVTAMPYGVNTVTMFAFILLIIAPVYHEAVATRGEQAAAELAWRVGLLACLVSGLTELVAALAAERLRRIIPRAALLSVLAAVGVAFIASEFGYRIYQRPVVAMLPMAIVLLVYFARVRFPWGLPGGLVALLVGTLLAWSSGLWDVHLFDSEALMSAERVGAAWATRGWRWPVFCGSEIVAVLNADFALRFLGVTVPLGLLSALGSLQNIESAASAGDRFDTTSCLAVDGIGTIAAALFGSCFPTTMYIGHPGWKGLGARAGYSVLNAGFFTLVFLGGVGGLIAAVVPIEAGAAIVLWIGIVITAQSYEATPPKHFPAVAIAFFPAVAAWVAIKCELLYGQVGAGEALADVVRDNPHAFWIGLYALAGANSGFVLTCTILSGISVALIDHRFLTAGIWALAGAGLTIIGMQHAFRLGPMPPSRELMIWQWDLEGGTLAFRGFGIAVGYGLAAGLFGLIHVLRKHGLGFGDLAGSPEQPAGQESAGDDM
ncbi:MAG TPA: NCS2 family permease [Phycisphaerae bacterium]|nr:NCS2 family permease [Phycisphaerae bacterium]